MKRRAFVLLLTFSTPVQAVVFGLLTDNPNWPWNIPLGLAFGYVAGVVLWPPVRRFQSWLDRRCVERDAAEGLSVDDTKAVPDAQA